MKWRRKIIIAALVGAVMLAVIYGFLPKPVPVEVEDVRRGTLQVTIEEEGKTRVKHRFVISAPVGGFSRRIDLDVGDEVKEGQLLVQLEPQRSTVLDPRSRGEAEARLQAAKAALKAAEQNARAAAADDEYARVQLERLRRLHEAESVSRNSLDQAETEATRSRATLRSAEFAVEVARFELEEARTVLRYSASEEIDYAELVSLRAPVAGRVLKVHHESEGAVSTGEELLEIGDPCALEVEVDVLSADSVRIKPGTPVLFERWGGEAPLEGQVRLIEPVGFTKVSALGIEEQRVLVIADITSPAETWRRLGDGYRVEARFVVWESDDVLQVPASALFRHREGWAVFIYRNGRAHSREVRVGHRGGLRAEILSGLEEGETVITHPDRAVEDGTRVKLRHQ
jgi:HlyD family secretion protein